MLKLEVTMQVIGKDVNMCGNMSRNFHVTIQAFAPSLIKVTEL